MKSLLARPDEVRAFIVGRKTMLRRVVKWPKWIDDYEWAAATINEGRNVGMCVDGRPAKIMRLPYAPGDTVAVKETWRETAASSQYEPVEKFVSYVDYRADGGTKCCSVDHARYGGEHRHDGTPKWRSSAQMPLWAVRLHLLVAAVKMERLQSISEADARAEGYPVNWDGKHYDPPPPELDMWQGYGTASICLDWDRHAKPGERWADNCWVAAYTVEVKHA